MSRLLTGVLAIVAVPVVLVGGCLALVDRAFDGMCANDEIQTIASPDGTLKAVVFSRGCGATTGSSTQVSVLSANASLPNRGGNVFVADTGSGAAPSGPGGGPPLRVVWNGPHALTIQHPPKARVFSSPGSLAVRRSLFASENISVRYSSAPGMR